MKLTQAISLCNNIINYNILIARSYPTCGLIDKLLIY